MDGYSPSYVVRIGFDPLPYVSNNSSILGYIWDEYGILWNSYGIRMR